MYILTHYPLTLKNIICIHAPIYRDYKFQTILGWLFLSLYCLMSFIIFLFIISFTSTLITTKVWFFLFPWPKQNSNFLGTWNQFFHTLEFSTLKHKKHKSIWILKWNICDSSQCKRIVPWNVPTACFYHENGRRFQVEGK